jgi:PPOX class probable F420-dependent enzyme
MADLGNSGVRRLLTERNHAVLSTLGGGGEVHATVVWIDLLDGLPAINGDVTRVWCQNLARDSRVTLVVVDSEHPSTYVEIRGRAQARTEGAVDHDDRLAEKFLGPGARNCERGAQRVTWLITPDRVRFTDTG